MHQNGSSLVDLVVGFLFGAGGASFLNWLLRRRESRADIVAKQQDVIDSLWQRIDALQRRVEELERELDRIESEARQLRRLGTPPRAWGQRSQDLAQPLEDRYTPTCVGTI